MARRCAGSSGSVNGVSHVLSWSVSLNNAAAQVCHSDSGGYKEAVVGVKSWSGSFQCYSTTKPYSAGEEISFSGNSNVISCSGDAIVNSVKVSFNFDSCAPIVWDISFTGTGACTIEAGTGDCGTAGTAGGIPTALGGYTSISEDTSSCDYTESCDMSGGFATSESEGWACYCVGPKTASLNVQCHGDAPAESLLGSDHDFSVLGCDVSISGTVHITGISPSVDNNSAEPIGWSITAVGQLASPEEEE